MIKQMDKEHQKIVDEEISKMEEQDISIDTLVVKIKDDFFCCMSKEEHKKRLSDTLSEERHNEINAFYEETSKRLEKNGMEVMFCLLSMNEGGGVLIIPEESLKYKFKVMEVLEDMSSKYR